MRGKRSDGEVLAEGMEELRRRAGIGSYSCDGGAALAKIMAAKLGIEEVTLKVGLYWHRDAETLALIRGEDPKVYEDMPWDEHHHWLEGPGWIYDANAELRGEPHFQDMSLAVRHRYEVREDLDWDEFLLTDPSEWIKLRSSEAEKKALSLVEVVVAQPGNRQL